MITKEQLIEKFKETYIKNEKTAKARDDTGREHDRLSKEASRCYDVMWNYKSLLQKEHGMSEEEVIEIMKSVNPDAFPF